MVKLIDTAFEAFQGEGIVIGSWYSLLFWIIVI